MASAPVPSPGPTRAPGPSAPSDASRRSASIFRRQAGWILFACVCTVYLPSVASEFVYDDFEVRAGARARALGCAAFAVALLGKEQAIVLPGVVVLADLLGISEEPPGRAPRRWLARYARDGRAGQGHALEHLVEGRVAREKALDGEVPSRGWRAQLLRAEPHVDGFRRRGSCHAGCKRPARQAAAWREPGIQVPRAAAGGSSRGSA